MTVSNPTLTVWYMLALVALLFSSVRGQSSSSTTDESLIDRPARWIDFPGCYSDLVAADGDADGFVKSNEYLTFIQEYGKRLCFSTDAVTLQQKATFNTLACICRSQDNAPEDCCMEDNARIPIAGATVPESEQTPSQKNYLTSVCKLTDATIDGQCSPANLTRTEPAANASSTVPSPDSGAVEPVANNASSVVSSQESGAMEPVGNASSIVPSPESGAVEPVVNASSMVPSPESGATEPVANNASSVVQSQESGAMAVLTGLALILPFVSL